MIVARRLLQASLKPLSAAIRLASTTPKVSKEKAHSQPAKANGQSEAPNLLDLADTLKCVNYRYDFPQGLTEEQKKSMKRFDVFRYFLCK